jgi:hypothetical protein
MLSRVIQHLVCMAAIAGVSLLGSHFKMPSNSSTFDTGILSRERRNRMEKSENSGKHGTRRMPEVLILKRSCRSFVSRITAGVRVQTTRMTLLARPGTATYSSHVPSAELDPEIMKNVIWIQEKSIIRKLIWMNRSDRAQQSEKITIGNRA